MNLCTRLFWMGTVCSLGVVQLYQGVTAQEKPAVDSSGQSSIEKSADPSSDPKQAIIQEALNAISKRDIALAREKLDPLAVAKDSLHEEVVLAQLLFASKLNVDGKKVLEKLAIDEPKRLDVYLMFSEIAVNEQRWFDAWNLINLAERVTTPEGWSPTFRRRIGNRLDILKARCFEGREGWEKAKEIYVKLGSTEDNGPEIWIGQARCEYRLKNFSEAIKLFAKVKEQNPDIAPPELMLAKQFESDQDVKQAEKYFREATTKPDINDKDKKKASLEFARFLIFNNRATEAIELVKVPFLSTPAPDASAEDTAKDPMEALERERLFLNGVVARLQQRFSDAQAIFSKLHQQDAFSFPIGNHLALCLIESDQEVLRARSLQIAEVNARSNPNLQDAWSTLGYIQFKLGDMASADKSLTTAIQSGQLNRDTAGILSMVKQSLGDEDSAKQLRTQAELLPGPNFYPNK
jgi:tetratricopeptide (TPR) repeat protein